MLTQADGLKYQLLGQGGTTNQLDHDINFWVTNHRSRIIRGPDACVSQRFEGRHIATTGGDNANRLPCAPLDFAAVTGQNVYHALSHVANAQ